MKPAHKLYTVYLSNPFAPRSQKSKLGQRFSIELLK